MAEKKPDEKAPEQVKAIAKHRKLNADELKALKSTAPTGSRELAPGKSFCIGSKAFKSAIFSIQPDKEGKEELKRDRVKKCYVPDTLVKGLKLKDGLFLSK